MASLGCGSGLTSSAPGASAYQPVRPVFRVPGPVRCCREAFLGPPDAVNFWPNVWTCSLWRKHDISAYLLSSMLWKLIHVYHSLLIHVYSKQYSASGRWCNAIYNLFIQTRTSYFAVALVNPTRLKYQKSEPKLCSDLRSTPSSSHEKKWGNRLTRSIRYQCTMNCLL